MTGLAEIDCLLEERRSREKEVLSVLKKAASAKGLSIEEAAVLLNVEDSGLLKELYRTAAEVREKTFGKRVVLFAPLYISNYCTNGCLYCGFRAGGQAGGMGKLALTPAEVVREAKALEGMGLKRVLLVTGEDPGFGLDHITACVEAVYKNTGIRIVHVNAPPMDTDSFKTLKEAGVGVYQSFQETYHEPTYKVMHPTGRKKDYTFRLTTMDRAMEAGFGDVGVGPLLGLYDFRYDCLATIAHSLHLYERYGAHAHTISIPRLRRAEGGLPCVPYPVADEELKKITAVFRLTLPTAGVVVSTRESLGLRRALMRVGATQLSAASRTNPGGYTGAGKTSLEQFSTEDHSSMKEVIRSIIEEGFTPSLCTTCYRTGRTGTDFMEKTVSGGMERFCTANAALTLKEYMEDYPGNGMAEDLEKVLKRSLEEIKDANLREAVVKKLKEIEEGKRDLFF